MFEHARERVRAFVNARLDARSHLHARHHRIDQPRGAVLRAPAPAARRRDPAHRARAPRQHRALAAASPSRPAPSSRPCPWIGAASSTSTTFAAHMNERTRIVACAHVSNALGTVLPVREIIAARARARRAWCSSTAPRPCRTSASTCRRSTATSMPSRRTRCTAPPASACCIGRESLLEAMPPWQGGGDMILTVSFEKTTYNDAAVQVRGRHAEHLRRGRAWRAAIDYIDSLGIDTHRTRTSSGCSSYATSKLEAVPGLHHHRHGAGQGRGDLVHARRHPPARPRHDPRRRRRRGAHRSSLRHAGHGVLRRARDGARLVRLLLRASPTSTRWWPRWPRHARCSADGPQGPLPRRDPRSQQQPAQLRPARSGRLVAPTATIRCAATGCTSRCGSTAIASRGPALRRQGLRDLGGLGVADERGRQGQTTRRDRAPVRRDARGADASTTRRCPTTSASSPRCPACANSRCA